MESQPPQHCETIESENEIKIINERPVLLGHTTDIMPQYYIRFDFRYDSKDDSRMNENDAKWLIKGND